jgi:hypothetical protein
MHGTQRGNTHCRLYQHAAHALGHAGTHPVQLHLEVQLRIADEVTVSALVKRPALAVAVEAERVAILQAAGAALSLTLIPVAQHQLLQEHGTACKNTAQHACSTHRHEPSVQNHIKYRYSTCMTAGKASNDRFYDNTRRTNANLGKARVGVAVLGVHRRVHADARARLQIDGEQRFREKTEGVTAALRVRYAVQST